LREAQQQVSGLGAQVIGVATVADYQAQALIDAGMPFPLLLDPENLLRRELGIAGRFSLARLLHPQGAVAYWRAARQAKDFGPIWSQATQRPAVVIVDDHLEVGWSHFGKQLGDYPTVGEVLAATARIAGR
jgi:peroxiredoxin